MAGKKVVVIGGGFGGAAAAIKARASLDAEHIVTLVDRNRKTFLCGMNPLLIVGQREVERSSRSLGVLANRGINFLQAEVSSIDYAGKTVDTSGGTLEYDYLVIAAGAEYDWDHVPGSAEAYSFYNIDTARRLRRRLSRIKKGRIAIGVASVPYKCPPAPYEAAMYMDWWFRERGIRADIEIEVATPEPGPVPVAGPDAMSLIRRALDRKGIELKTEAPVTEVAADGRAVQYGNGDSSDVDVAVTIPHHVVAGLVRGVSNTGLIGEGGWVKVDPKTLETNEAGVYAIGDVNAVPMANGRGVPKAGVFASAEGETVAQNIAAAINGTEAMDFPGEGYCFLGFNPNVTALVTGRFMAEGKPDVRLTSPSARGARKKERFERDWKRFRV